MILFDIISITTKDIIEIVLVTYVLYKLYRLMRGTIAVQIFVGIGALFVLQALVRLADMTMLNSVFGPVSEVLVIAIIVLFQPEIRRLLLLLGQNSLLRRFLSVNSIANQEELVNEVVEAVRAMSSQRVGALIAFERSTGLRSYVETGAQLQAQPTRDLLVTIFHGKNPLHDGAVIIRNRRIEAARCILPVSTNMRLSPHLGLRHRAALGLSEQSDAFVVVVSEETGGVSTAKSGSIETSISLDTLREQLSAALRQGSAASSQDVAILEPAETA